MAKKRTRPPVMYALFQSRRELLRFFDATERVVELARTLADLVSDLAAAIPKPRARPKKAAADAAVKAIPAELLRPYQDAADPDDPPDDPRGG